MVLVADAADGNHRTEDQFCKECPLESMENAHAAPAACQGSRRDLWKFPKTYHVELVGAYGPPTQLENLHTVPWRT